MERLDGGVKHIIMEVLKNWTRPRILPFLGLFFLYAFTRPLAYGFLHDPVLVVVIKTSSIWYLVFYVQVIKDMGLPTSAKVKDHVSSNDAGSLGDQGNGQKHDTTFFSVGGSFSSILTGTGFLSGILSKISRSSSSTSTNDVESEVASSTEGERLVSKKNNIHNVLDPMECSTKDVCSSVFVIHQNSDNPDSFSCLNNEKINDDNVCCCLDDKYKENDYKFLHSPGQNENHMDKIEPYQRLKNNDIKTNDENASEARHGKRKERDEYFSKNNSSFLRRVYNDDTVQNTEALQLKKYFNKMDKTSSPPNNPSREEGYKQFFTLALVVSSMGDAFMIFPSTFVAGVLSYGSAHLLSIVGFQNRFTRPRFSWLIYPYNAIGFVSILVWIRSIQMALIIFAYTFMLTTVFFYALSNLETRPSIQNLLAAIGAAFYIWSDTMIAYDKWIFQLPFRDALVWSTYFFAQMNLALSV